LSTQETKLKAIADAIREKDGTAAPILANDFAERIRAISTVPDNLRTINFTAEPPEGGTVSSGGLASDGIMISANAIANKNYIFDSWEENGTKVSEEALYTFSVNTDRNLIAMFIQGYILGADWWAGTIPSSPWTSCAYGNGKFVAVSNKYSYAAYSTDGINWTASSSLPSALKWSSVTYGNGKFVAVATDNVDKAAYSTDGINWVETTLPLQGYWSSVAYGNGKFVIVSNYHGDKGAYSTDGINWVETTLPLSYRSVSCTYGNGKFLIVAGGDEGAYSTDGINWTKVNLPSATKSWSSVTYGDGKFVAVAENSSVTAYSSIKGPGK